MQLIVNADDFGMSDEVNNNIIKCHAEGIVTSTTLLANGPKFDEAINLAKSYPDLGIDVHLSIDGPYNIGSDYASLINHEE